MDQDFHYYGTYYAALLGGFPKADATRIAKAANFIDFLHEGAYGGYWRLVRNERKPSSESDYKVIAQLDNPRYTFQAGKLSTGMSAEDGLWGSYHFTPGNHRDPSGTPTSAEVHGAKVANALPGHQIRDVDSYISTAYHKLLNRPQSPLSRALLADARLCATSRERLEQILIRATAGWESLRPSKRDDCLARFRQILLGVRAHVIADTWAHQDFALVSDKINTYWDVNGSNWGRQSIDYDDGTGGGWTNVVLSATSHENLQAVPNGTSYLGHGWLGHFPDYSFVKFRYKPCWAGSNADPVVRDNPTQYRYAFLELCSLFSRANAAEFDPDAHDTNLAAAAEAIASPCELASKAVCPRAESSKAWMRCMTKRNLATPDDDDKINAKLEPDDKAVLPGMLAASTAKSRYGHYYVQASSDLYLFQVAADYHFHFVKHWLAKHDVFHFRGTWSEKVGPLSPFITDLWDE